MEHNIHPSLPHGEAAGEAPERRATRAAGVPDQASLRLDKRTYLDNQQQGRYRANLIDYGGGLCEVGWSFVSIRPPKPSVARGQSDTRVENESRAARRARSTIRKKVLSFGLDHLLTLTYRDNVTDFDQASADLARFVRLVKGKNDGFPYVAVPEKQARGAWHWHLAVKGRQDVNQLRHLWRKTVGEGNIDVQQPRGGQNRRVTLVSYLSKYLSKGFEAGHRELNGHRYRASIGLEVPSEAIPIPEEARVNVEAYVLARLVERSKQIGHRWKEDNGLAGWACSWK
jgi:hypothetical protein